MNQDNISGLGRGERALDFVLPVQKGTPTRFYAVAGGRPTVLFFCTKDALLKLPDFTEALNKLTADDIAVLAVVQKGESNDFEQISFSVFFDNEGKVRMAYRLQDGDGSVVFVLDPNLRVLGSVRFEQASASAQKVAAMLDNNFSRIEPTQIVTQAPVLLIPRVLDAKMCEQLIGVWETHGSEETGVEQTHKGERKDIISHERKRRRDHIVMDKDLMKHLTMTIGRRVMPEVRKAFAFKATRFEGFKIACYDAATGGYFHAHRDNLSPSTAHRRFALTLNLNGGYEGGYLRFPEYGPHLYRPNAGDAVVFSSSHLHEVTSVTKGRRFTLLSFLFSEADVRATKAQ